MFKSKTHPPIALYCSIPSTQTAPNKRHIANTSHNHPTSLINSVTSRKEVEHRVGGEISSHVPHNCGQTEAWLLGVAVRGRLRSHLVLSGSRPTNVRTAEGPIAEKPYLFSVSYNSHYSTKLHDKQT